MSAQGALMQGHSTQRNGLETVTGSGLAFYGCWDDNFISIARSAKDTKKGKNFSRRHRTSLCTVHCVLRT
jgi:hypothetical protein